MASEAVGTDEFGNMVDAQGQVVDPSVQASFPKESDGEIASFEARGYEKLTPKEKFALTQLRKSEEIKEKKKKRAEELKGKKFRHPKFGGASGTYDDQPVENQEFTQQDVGLVAGTAYTGADKRQVKPQVAAPSAIDIALAKTSALEKEIANLSTKRSEAEAEVIKQQGENAKAIFAAQERSQDAYETQLDKFKGLQTANTAALQSVEDDIREAERSVTRFEIDPNRAFKSTGSRIGAAIAIAAGAFAQGLSGGNIPNTAYQIVKDAIDNDILAQREEMAKRKGYLANKNNIYGKMLQKFGTQEEAHLLTMNMGITVAKMELEKIASRQKSEGAQRAAQLISAKLDEEAARNRQSLMGYRTKLAIAKETLAQKTGGGRAAALRKDRAQKSLSTALNVLRRARNAFAEVGPLDGAWGSFLKGIGGDVAVGALGGEDSLRYEVLRTQMAHFYTNATNGARPTDKDFAIVLGLIPAAMNSKGKAEIMFDTLEQTLMQAQSTGVLADGAIEQIARSAGLDVDRMILKHESEAKSYLDNYFREE